MVLTRTISVERCDESLIGMGSRIGEEVEIVYVCLCGGVQSKKVIYLIFLRDKGYLYANENDS